MFVSSSVSAEDLLARPAQPVYGLEARALIEGKIVLVTGAGGSIGSELVRQCRRLGAAKVYCVDNDEYALYMLELRTTGQALLDGDHLILADVRDEALMRQVMEEKQPDIVFHAAACKHLPLLEKSPESAVKTNVFGTRSVVRAAVNAEVGHVVNISTDKAANPTSMLGWSKRLAEHVTKDFAYATSTKLANVRFGNVLGSRGSFLETLSHTVNAGKPVAITDPDVTRYFMTIPEAAGLVIEAARLANGGSTFVLDMGEPVRILDIVKKFARLSGTDDPEIVITGLRPGEKLHEELFDSREKYEPTAHPLINSAHVESHDTSLVLRELEELIGRPTDRTAICNALAFRN